MTSVTDPETFEAIRRIEDELTPLISSIRHLIRIRAERVKPGLSPIGYRTLALIERFGTLQAGTLADLLLVDKSVISRTARLLEEDGFITRHAVADDRRGVTYTTSDLGLELLLTARKDNQPDYSENLAAWGAEELNYFAEYLARFNQDLRIGSRTATPAESEQGE